VSLWCDLDDLARAASDGAPLDPEAVRLACRRAQAAVDVVHQLAAADELHVVRTDLGADVTARWRCDDLPALLAVLLDT
jgi:hypothetical protein